MKFQKFIISYDLKLKKTKKKQRENIKILNNLKTELLKKQIHTQKRWVVF